MSDSIILSQACVIDASLPSNRDATKEINERIQNCESDLERFRQITDTLIDGPMECNRAFLFDPTNENIMIMIDTCESAPPPQQQLQTVIDGKGSSTFRQPPPM